MKTTFKTVLSELDDEVMNINISENEYTDIDIDKIKGEVFMHIHGSGKKSTGKNISKKFLTLLIAAVLLTAGTIGAFASGSIQAIFGKMMAGESNLNALGLYDGGNITASSTDPTLDVKLLGVTGDGKKFYSAIEITKKDGNPVIDCDRAFPVEYQKQPFTSEHISKDGSSVIAGESFMFDITDNNRSIILYLETIVSEGDLQGGRMTVNNSTFQLYQVDEIYDSEELTKSLNEVTEDFIDESNNKSEELVRKHNLTWGDEDIEKNNFWVIDNGGVRYYCKAHWQKIDLPFEISYDLCYSEDSFISVDLSAENAPDIVSDIANEVQFSLTPVGAYLYGQCSADKTGTNPDNLTGDLTDHSPCFKSDNITDGSCRVIMNDGTVYYLLTFEGESDTTDGENGVYYDTLPLTLSTIPERWWNREILAIDTREISEIILCGDTVYSK